MAEGVGLLDQDLLSCAICSDLLKDPVTTPCGHSFCILCIRGYWDQVDHTGVYSCPQCRETFTPKPVLGRNTLLARVVEKLKKTGLQATPPAHCYAGPGDVGCDVCAGEKRKAVKSCLVCLASYCETHLQPHSESAPLKKHKLVKASGTLQEKICPRHDKLLDIYCQTEQECICYLCTIENHRGHDTVSVATERTEKQKQVCVTQNQFRLRIQKREKELQDLRQAVLSLKLSAKAAVEESEGIFDELIHFIKKRRSEVKAQVRDQEKAAVSRADGLLEQLEQEIAELGRRDAELEQLLHTPDNIHFLQKCQPLCAPLCAVSVMLNPHSSFETQVSVSELKEQLEDVCTMGLLKIAESVKEVDILQIPQPSVKEEFLQYYRHLTLDPNTAHSKLSLSKGNRQVTHVKESQLYPDLPARFDHWEQVLCREGLTGRHYWEVEWSGEGYVYIAVSYEGMKRQGSGHYALLGYNDKSWSLWCSPTKCYFYHNKEYTTTPNALSCRVGVYLDHRAGILSFYSISDTMTLLHSTHTKFTQPLYPGFYANTVASTVKLCAVESRGSKPT